MVFVVLLIGILGVIVGLSFLSKGLRVWFAIVSAGLLIWAISSICAPNEVILDKIIPVNTITITETKEVIGKTDQGTEYIRNISIDKYSY